MVISFLRSITFNIAAFILTLVMGVCAFPIRWFFQKQALPYARLWSRGVLWLFCRVCGVHVHIIGKENISFSGPALIASQHQSAFDTLIWMLLLPRPCYVMKGELRRIPLLGPMLVLTGMMPIERNAGAKALRLLLQETDKAIKAEKQIIIFPEGTRTKPGEHKPLKPGIAAMAQHTKMSVIPVATNSGHFWGRNAFIKRCGTLYVVIGEAIKPSPREIMLKEIEQSWEQSSQLFRSKIHDLEA